MGTYYIRDGGSSYPKCNQEGEDSLYEWQPHSVQRAINIIITNTVYWLVDVDCIHLD